ncbi:MAG: hypothetical protein QF479_02860 [Candidatus Poseidoniaceae archaeon]|nr:hypothetical protein [Candidatus Poseidoniaceae archaeon]
MFRRVRILFIVAILLSISSFTQANPGGVGDDVFDMQCGGACHGDSSLNQTSSATISVQLEGTPYIDQPIAISAVISGAQLSYSGDLGVFLLTDTTGHSDTPADAQWEILSDSKGGTNNYLEGKLLLGQDNFSASWTIKPTTLTTTTFYVSIHHGGDDIPYFGVSSGLQVEVLPIPDNLARLSSDFTPQTTRPLGEDTSVLIETEDVSSVKIEWKVEGSSSTTVIANSSGNNIWEFIAPASNQPSAIQWRAILEGEGPSQTTPWFTLVAQEPPFEVDQTAVYLQSSALFIFVLGLVLSVQIKLSKGKQIEKHWEQTEQVAQDNTSMDIPPLPDGQLPPGWTMEQWQWYGHEYLQELKEGAQ